MSCCPARLEQLVDGVQHHPKLKQIYGENCIKRTPQNDQESIAQRLCGSPPSCGCIMEAKIDRVMENVGGMSLLFCFFEMFGVWLAIKFRRMKDPFFEALSNARNSIPIRRRSDQ